MACSEVGEYGAYDYVVVNDALASAVDSLRAIVLAERAKVESMRTTAEAIIGTFPTRSDRRSR